jgi:peptidoglycan/LPS O-acetylase OafA/YrhL
MIQDLPAARARPALDQLTSLRFFAALAIVFHHFGSLAFTNPKVLAVFSFLSSGVSFFFVLSGFVLVYAYASDSGVRSLRLFYQARLARLYPVYFLGLALMLIVTLHQYGYGDRRLGEDIIAPALLSMFLFQAWIPRMANLLNGPGWSLSSEAFFYLVFPMLMSRGARRFLESHKVPIAIVSCVLGTVPLLVLTLAFPNASKATMDSPAYAYANWAAFWPPVRLPEFVIGILIGLEFLKPNRTEFPLRIVGGAVATIALLLIGVPLEWRPLFHNSLLAPLFATIIYGLAISKGRIARLLSSRGLVLLGESSFALYILHFPLRSLVGSLWGRLFHSSPGFVFFWLYLALCIASSILVFRYLETPMRIWIRNIGSRRNPPG